MGTKTGWTGVGTVDGDVVEVAFRRVADGVGRVCVGMLVVSPAGEVVVICGAWSGG